MKRVRINLLAISIYLFGFIIFYLAGSYINSFFSVLFFAYLLFPLLSLGLLFYSYAGLRYYQKFSTERPVKGEEVIYTLYLSNETLLPIMNVFVKFKIIQPGHKEKLEDLAVYMKRREDFSKDYKIKCPYRGIYSVGMDSLELQDMLGWFSLGIKVWHRIFYVHPRIIEIEPSLSEYNKSRKSIGTHRGSLLDNTLLKSLKVYRPGESVRHIFWKKLISTGHPFLKTYDQTASPGIDIYLDLRRETEPDPVILEREDCSVEILVALVKYFLGRNINTAVRCFGTDEYSFNSSQDSMFDSFYRSTFNMYFAKTISPTSLFEYDLGERNIVSNFILFISHVIDPEILELSVEYRNSSLSVVVVLNLTGKPETERITALNYIKSIKERGGYVLEINNPHTIKEDLES
jgi:uncharacterized protein (DUF58 family)